MPDSSPVTVFGPASLSNLGPGYDALGLCITGLGDRVTAWRTEAAGVTVEGPPSLPTDPEKNTAGRAARHVLRQSGAEGGVALRIEKGIPMGSGVGGSSASAVAGAFAANEVLGRPFDKRGLVLVSPSDPTVYRRLTLPAPPPLAIVLPDVEVLTRDARAVLPETVPHSDASAQAAEIAFLMRALLEGDWPAVGAAIMRDRLAEPFRAPLVPVYEAVRQAALDAGAAGCALTGSGPALFAIPGPVADAQVLVDAMIAASRAGGVDATGWVARVDPQGVRVVDAA